MKVEHWMQILVGVVILSALGFYGAQLFDIKGTLSSVKTQVEAIDNRVSRIADTLPEVKARVAWEEVNFAIAGFVTVSKPKKLKNKWITTVSVYKRDSENMVIYRILSDKVSRNYASYIIAGKLKAEHPYESSFSELAAHSATLQQAVMIPKRLNASTSFVLRSDETEDLSKFISTLTKEDPKTVKLGKIRNWKELSKMLDKIVELQEPNEQVQPMQ
ncbi:MAG: hypothetical protein J7J44_05785 [Deltaproteobacteria bacterium]|nr:hypothetical protein [Deltaproteobacteria bacterium]